MVFMESWDAFYSSAEKLYSEHPDHTRYVMKYRHCDGKLELKVTNDRVCLKFLTDQAADLKRIEKLNNLFLTVMVGKDPQNEPLEDAMAMRSDRPTSSEDPDKQAGASSNKKKKVKR